MTTPVIKLRDFGVSTAVFKWECDGKNHIRFHCNVLIRKKTQTNMSTRQSIFILKTC